MENTTVGRRIAAERKKLGLSQEALGEKMGVSRQAISKWEADAAVPEIDKLIALSKLFGVSLNWLLGVEEEAPAPEMPQPEPAGTEATKPAFSIPRWLHRFAGPAVIGVTVLFLIWLLLYTVNSGNREHQYQLNYLNSRVSQLESRIAALELTQSADTAGSLLASYSFDIDATEDKTQASVVFTAVPHSWQAGDTGSLSILGSGVSAAELPCQWNGTRLTAAAVLDFADGYELCFTLIHSDGSRQIQLLSNDVLQNLKSAFIPILSGTVASGTYLPEENTLQLKDLSISYNRADYGIDAPVTWRRISLVLFADGEEVARRDHFNAQTQPQDSTATSGGGTWRTVAAKIELQGYVPEPGQALELRLCAEMSSGVAADTLLAAWVVGPEGQLEG